MTDPKFLDLPDGRRTAAYSESPAMIEAMLGEECCGSEYALSGGEFRPLV